jgi:AcrR family transcriptional regulator
MPERSRRIIDSAIQLANEGGFQAVRLRDVAAHSGVALGTLYTRFRSKEDILVAALEEELAKLDEMVKVQPPPGDTPQERVTSFFTIASRVLFTRQHFARAVLKSLASGEPETAEKVLAFHSRISSFVMRSMLGGGSPHADADVAAGERLCFMLQQIWFANLVGWMGGLQDEDEVIARVEEAVRLLSAHMLTPA